MTKPRHDQGPDYERGFIDGMQHQMQSSVDKAVNRMAQPEPPPECQTEAEKKAFAFGWFKAMEAQRLAQPKQEPVACPYCKNSATLGAVYYDQNCVECVKRMTAPPQRPWVGLTADELNMIGDRMRTWNSHSLADVYVAIEAKLKEKNT